MEAAIFPRPEASERCRLSLLEQWDNGTTQETFLAPNSSNLKCVQINNIPLPCEATRVILEKTLSGTAASESWSNSDNINSYFSLRRMRRLRASVWGLQSQIQEQRTTAVDAAYMSSATLFRISLGEESCSIDSLVSVKEGGKRSSIPKQRTRMNIGKVFYHHLLSTPGLPSRQNLTPASHLSQGVLPPSVPPTIANIPPSNQDDRPTQVNSAPNPPPIEYRLDIEQSDPFPREEESPPPPDEGGENNRELRSEEERHQSLFLLPLYGIAVFLGPVNIVSGMTASHGDNWKLAFVGSFVVWLVVGTTWLFLDLHGLQRASLTKRCLWHVAGCIAALYFFMSVLHITSDNLPQWLPTIIDCGVGTSLGFQNIPASARHRVGESITSIIGGIFGGTQVVVRREEQQPLQSVQSSASRGRRADIEMGPLA
ncbi:hypothetical protein V8E51_005284 [Hyaloscypha variabilis]